MNQLTRFFKQAVRLSSIIGASSMMIFAPGYNQSVNAFEINSLEEDTTGFSTILNDLQVFVQEEGIAIDQPGTYQLDPSKLILAMAQEVTIFFVNEGAGYKNQLEFTATYGSNVQSGLIFSNISCAECIVPEADGVLRIGDWVNLGHFEAGTQFDFTLIANGYNGGTWRYGTVPQLNPDGLEHIVAYEYGDYVVIGFEDLYGELGLTDPPNENSDRDFNDVIFAVRMNVINESRQSKPVPEPSLGLGLLLTAGLAGLVKKQK
jgi:hypothetical protein